MLTTNVFIPPSNYNVPLMATISSVYDKGSFISQD
ncbi:unnamed protein product [Brassica oleracea]